MSAATTIAPAPKPTHTAVPRQLESQTADPQPIEHQPIAEPQRVEHQSMVVPQHIQALAKANEIRLARAELKRQVAAGMRCPIEVIRDCPVETQSMAIGELLASQRRWGSARARKLVTALKISESKKLGTLTERQRGILANALEAKTV